MKIGSLFSGYEGLGMAVQSVLGGDIAWVSDIDPGACKILAHRYPDVPNIGDITAVDWSAVEPVDVLTGGFPCQDVSSAGLRKGLRPDTRSGLWTHFAHAINQLRPPLVVIENVRGLLSAEAHCDVEPCPWCVGDADGVLLRALGAVLGDLADIGYDASWQGVQACDIGAPHERFRTFVLAWPAADADRLGLARGRRPRHRRARSADDHLAAADPDGNALRVEPVTLTRRRRSAFAGHAGPDAAADANHAADDGKRSRTEPRCGGEATADAQGHGRQQGRAEPAWIVGRPDVALGGDATAPHAHDDGRARLGRELSVERDADGCGSTHTLWGDYEPAIRRWERLTRPAPPPREPGGKSGERLAPVFVEWMQGLPEGWVTDPAIWDGMTDKKGRVLTGRRLASARRDAQLKALGNGVVPQQAAQALRLLLPDITAVAA